MFYGYDKIEVHQKIEYENRLAATVGIGNVAKF